MPTNPPPARPHPRGLDFGAFRLRFDPFLDRLAPFGSVSGLFRVRFGVLGGVGVGSGRGASVREKNITMLRPPHEVSPSPPLELAAQKRQRQRRAEGARAWQCRPPTQHTVPTVA